MNITVSGLVNIETNLKIDKFPINYSPIEYNFFGINNNIGGVGFNISKALSVLGRNVNFHTLIGKDKEANQIIEEFDSLKFDKKLLHFDLKATPQSVIVYDNFGKRKIYCDLKDIQDYELTDKQVDLILNNTDLLVACNINFNRKLIKEAKKKNIIIATDVHVLTNIDDEYNKEFMEHANILVFSNEGILGNEMSFLKKIVDQYNNDLVIITMGSQGVLYYDKSIKKIMKLDAIYTEKIVNTVGAGDAFFASFIHFYAKSKDLEKSIKLAQTFASIKIKSSGASNGFISEDELLSIYRNDQR